MSTNKSNWWALPTKSTDDAISQAIERASETLRNLDWFEVTKVRGHIKDGKVAYWQVGLKIGMRLEGTVEVSAAASTLELRLPSDWVG